DRRRGAALAVLARRLASIDPERRGVGGTRFQLELALLDAATRSESVASPAPSAALPPPASKDARPTDVADARAAATLASIPTRSPKPSSGGTTSAALPPSTPPALEPDARPTASA